MFLHLDPEGGQKACSTRISIRSLLLILPDQFPLDYLQSAHLLLALFIHTGARRGEVLGLRREDIDFDKKLVHIRRNNTQITGKGAHIGTTKTKNGARDIPFGDHFKELLLPFRSTGYLFGGEEPFQSWDYDKLMRRLKKRVNLHGATTHVLRHPYLTMLAGEGVDLKTLQTIAGHANIQTTMDIYVSPRTDKITAAGETMDKLLNAYAS